MIEPIGNRPPLTPQLAVRVAVVGTVALAMFAVIFFRLWFLQVLSGSSYLAQAKANQVQTIPIPAERGEIVDRNGNVLVDSTEAAAVEISPQQLPVPIKTYGQMLSPPPADMAIYRRLARVLKMSTKPAACNVPLATSTLRQLGYGGAHPQRRQLAQIPCLVAQQLALEPYGNVTLLSPAPAAVQYYLGERANQFPGVMLQKVYVRNYPYGPLGAQVFGTIGRMNAAELNDPHFKGLPPDSIVGQSGLEYEYNRYLQGTAGSEQVQVNAVGQPIKILRVTPPKQGLTLKTSLDLSLERVGQQALAQSIAANPPANAGAFVAMDPQNGQIYAMGSLPSYNPNVLTKPLTQAQYDRMFGPASGDPLLNRAIQFEGQTGSVYKLITATAALQSGVWTPTETYDDTGCYHEGPICLHNAGHAAYGVINIVSAIKVSDDVFFYNLGALLNSNAPQGGALQRWARLYGFGQPTGIDLPGEATGVVPDPAYWNYLNQQETECDNATGPYAYTNPSGTMTGPKKLPGWHRSPKHPPGGCQIGTLTPWTYGDNVNAGVGQGDDQVTPIQLAVAYAAMANGGTVVTPHIGMDIQTANGTVLQRIQPPPKRHLHFNPVDRAAIMQGLHEAAQYPGGTSYQVMGNFPMKVYAKTGTAQYFVNGVNTVGGVQTAYAWYACFVPASETSRPIVVVVLVERGGYGVQAASPVAREILSQWFFGHPGKFY
jgi:penicillin-binding protein 2